MCVNKDIPGYKKTEVSVKYCKKGISIIMMSLVPCIKQKKLHYGLSDRSLHICILLVYELICKRSIRLR